MFLSETRKKELIKLVIELYNGQYATNFNPDDFLLTYAPGNYESRCSLRLNTERTDDNLRIKIYVKDFSNYSTFTRFKFEQEEDYGPYPEGEIHVTTAVLDRTLYRQLEIYSNRDYTKGYITTEDFTGDNIDDLLLTDDGFILSLEGENT